ncbi:MAG: hypothetical protein KAI67_01595 [Candidatus Pacebacteria bacterium]|nr:hypothetical protein [Candidatus Paceibacterota bacterium]
MFDSQYKDKLSLKGLTIIDVTDRMKGKVNELIKLSKLGIESEIINILKPSLLK